MNKPNNPKSSIHPKAKVNFLIHLRELASKLPRTFDPFKGIAGLTMRNGIPFRIDTHLEGYNKVFNTFSKLDRSGQKFSEDYLKDKLDKMLVLLLEDEKSDVEALYEKIASEIEHYDCKQTVLLPIAGLIVSNDIVIGNVTFKPNGDKAFTLTSFANSVDHNNNLIADDIKECLPTDVVATFDVTAEPKRAYELAVQEVRRALDLIRFAIGAIYGSNPGIDIGLLGEVHYSTTSSIVTSDDGTVSTNRRRVGALQPFSFDKVTAELRKRIGFDELSDMLKKEKLTDFESVILQCLYWFSTACTQTVLENKFLNLTTCLEAAFTRQEANDSSISNCIAESMAMFLVEQLEERKQLKARIKTLYGLRSKVSHGGSTVVQAGEVAELQNYAGWLIVVLIQNSKKFINRKQFWEMIEDRKLS